MNRPAARAAALAASVLLVLAGCGDDDDDAAQAPASTPVVTTEGSPSEADASASPSASASEDAADIQVIEINLEDGKPTEKVGPTVTVAKGDKLTLVISADSDQEIHVHGLDTYIEVPAGETVTKTLTITLSPGSYEVEVHETEILLFNLQVK